MIKGSPIFYQLLSALLAGGCLIHPASSAVGLLVVCSAQLAERFFTRNVTDDDRLEIKSLGGEIQLLKSEMHKLKLKSDQESLSKAFTR